MSLGVTFSHSAHTFKDLKDVDIHGDINTPCQIFVLLKKVLKQYFADTVIWFGELWHGFVWLFFVPFDFDCFGSFRLVSIRRFHFHSHFTGTPNGHEFEFFPWLLIFYRSFDIEMVWSFKTQRCICKLFQLPVSILVIFG